MLYLTPHSSALFVHARNLCSFGSRINNKIAPARLDLSPSSPWPKLYHKTFVFLLFHLVKVTLGLLHALCDLQPTFLHQALLAVPIWMAKNPRCRKTFLQLNASKSKGPDSIPAIALNSPLFSTFFQLSFTLGIFLSSWKLDHVFPIPKKGENSPLELSPHCNHLAYL